jgi:hypothetical protein
MPFELLCRQSQHIVIIEDCAHTIHDISSGYYAVICVRSVANISISFQVIAPAM